jgi:adenosylmethionine-8-amino-7-oxononanoate aminotransferase
MPIGAALISDRITDAFQGRDGLFAHGQTYGGHPAACAVALENIDILHEEALPDRAAVTGARLGDALRALVPRHRSLAHVRNCGLLLGLEILKDSKDGTDYQDRRAAGTAFRLALRDAGLIGICVHPGNVLLLAPPLIISDAECDQMVAMIDEALTAIEAMELP